MSAASDGARISENGAITLTADLRYGFLDEDGRALLGSHAIAASLGVAFLILVHLSPPGINPIGFLPDRETQTIIIKDLLQIPEPTVIATPDAGSRASRGASGDRSGAGRSSLSAAIGRAFGAMTGLVGDPRNMLGGVAVSSGGEAGVPGGKVVLQHGQGGLGSSAPERGGMGSGPVGGASGIGRVGAGENLGRATVRVTAPSAIHLDSDLSGGRDVAALGTFVRSRAAQLGFCYQEHGLKVNPGLAGSVTVSVDVTASGSVSDARVARRTWSGAGAAETETCILRTIRGWQLPPGDRAGTFSVPFSFTR